MKKANLYIISWLIILVGIVPIGCQKKNRQVSFPGYVEGRFTYISAYFTGVLKKLNVIAGEQVNPGQPLFTLEPFPEDADLSIANARVQQVIEQKNRSDANYVLQKIKNERNTVLFRKEVISKEELENSMSAYQQAYASKKAADAELLVEKAKQNKAIWAAKKNTVTAPMHSLVFNTYYSEHENISAGSPVISLLTPGSIKIIFFSPEYLLSQLKLNQNVDVSCDGCSQLIKAKITYLSPKAEYTPPVIFSQEQRQTLVFRVEAIPFATDNLLTLHPGQPVTVLLYTNNS